ncbi:MAG TPA: efflux RND transporter permease subunit [Actinomycetota bacterium]|nr:efflux RND transporter permease subunit [Actinomycetota bacterium]
MMRWIVGSSLKFRRLVIAVAAGVLVLGVTQIPKTSVDLLPEFKPTQVEVQTEALGLSAEEVEQLVTVPLEQDLLNGVAFLEEIESVSLPGLSSVLMTFEPGTSVLDARQVVAERLTQAVGTAGLPEVADPPQMLQPLSSTSRVGMVRLSSGELSLIDMSVLARWVIVPRLLGVEGVANVAIWGFRDKQLQVLVDPEQLRARGVSLQQIIRTSGNALEVSPLTFLEQSSPGTGGFIDTVNQRLHIFHEQAINTPAELAQVPLEAEEGGEAVFRGGNAVTLGDVAEVREDHQPLIGDAMCRDGECLLLVIEKFPGANTVEVTRSIDDALEQMRPGLSGIQIDTSMYRPASYIESSYDNLGFALLIGGILLLLVLGAFFFDWRTALTSVAAIVLSVVAAAFVLYLTRVTINTMVVAGMLIGLVVVIDDAVMDVQNVAQRLRRHRAEGHGMPAWRAVIEATLQIRTAMLYATLLAIAAVVPFFFMRGAAGAFVPTIALSFILTVAVSLVVALTVTTALGMMLLGNGSGRRGESPVVGWLRERYDRVSSRIVRRPAPAFALLGVILVAGLLAVPFLNTSLRPSLNERDVRIRLQAPPGTSLPKMNRDTAEVFRQVQGLQGVQNIGAHVGRAILSDRLVNVNSSEIWAQVDPSADYGATIEAIRGVANRYPQLSPDVLTYSEERVIDTLEETDNDIVVRVYGENEQTLQAKAQEVRGVLAGIEGISSPRVELPPQEPNIEIEADLARAERFGVKPGDVRRAAAALVNGIIVGQLFEEQKIFDVVVWGAPEIRESVDDIRALRIDAPRGQLVRLDQVADVRVAPNPTVIRHESVQTYVDVSADVAGRNVGDVAADVDRAIKGIEFPLEHHAELLGGFAEERAGRSAVLAVTIAMAIGIFLLLQAAFGSWRLAVLAFVMLPISLAGGLLTAALFAGGTLSLGVVAGLIAVLAIAARGVIQLIRHYQSLERLEGRSFGPEVVIEGTRDRVVPVLMSVAATAALLIPFLFTGNAPGFETLRPIAVVALGGLITSALLTLVVLPALYLRFGYVSERDEVDADLFEAVPEPDLVDR